MFHDNLNTFSTASKVLFILSIIITCFWILISLDAEGNIIIPIIAGIGGCVLSILMYGLSVIINKIVRIENKLDTILKGIDTAHDSENE